MDIEQVDHVLNSCERAPCLVGSPSELILVGFVGDMMVTAEALWVPSSCPVGNGTCDVSSGSQNMWREHSMGAAGSVTLSGHSQVGCSRLKNGVGWLLRWQMPLSISRVLCAHCCLLEKFAVVIVTRVFAVCLDDE